MILASAVVALGQNVEVKKLSSEADVPRITIEDAKKAFDDGKAVFVDSRGLDAYRQEHITGAVVIDDTAEDKFDKLPKGKKIIVYCS